MSFLRLSSAAAALLLAGSATADPSDYMNQCQSYGIDIQDGGSYFQNSLSSEPFTALESFTGCQDDFAYNIFVDTYGDQHQCSNTNLTPNNAPQLVNCTDDPKSSLITGDYSLLVISNNGDADPIAYERDFYLSVGPQQTVTETPTVTETVVTTPLTTATVSTSTTLTVTSVDQVTAKPSTTTSTTTRALITITLTTKSVSVVPTEVTVPASCVPVTSTRVPDPVCTIKPTILGDLDNIISGVNCVIEALLGRPCTKRDTTAADVLAHELPASAKFKRAILDGRTPDAELKRAYLAERRAKLARNIEKRAPDEPTITTTLTTGLPTYSTTVVAPTYTDTLTDVISLTSTSVVRSTVLPPPVTVYRTAFKAIVVSTATRVYTTTITNTVVTTPPGAAESCASATGTLAAS